MKIHELLESEENWTKGMYHRYLENRKKPLGKDEMLPDTSKAEQKPKAFCHCLQGAIQICYLEAVDQLKVETMIYKATNRSTVNYNDDPETTHEDILALCRELDI